ncbi:MAG: Mrp/NBP35 family ATP-binding protein [Proteobacteria bacterium]|nr:Mrp/NBP35 family ATP-binding protein [Pseudomonadota bacterium]
MESKIRNSLRGLVLPGTTLDALSILEHIKIDATKAFLVFHMPDNFAAVDPTWELAIQNACEKVCNLPILITFNRHNQIPPRATSGINGVHHVIAVASGKGGVGKSSICLNLALALQKQGLNVGILDADIYGPSLPTMTGVFEKPKTTSSKKLIPHQKFGLKLMSMGFMVPKDAAIIWRGLMVQSAIGQMLADVIWDEGNTPLDVLLIDMPPGTGDVQLTIAQKANLSGAIIVATSQELALIDARRAIKMFEKVNIPILGIVENMSNFLCPNCKTTSHIFPKQGVIEECSKQSMPLLGAIPLDIAFRESGDVGEPFLEKYQDHPISQIFNQMATTIKGQLHA